MKTRNLIALILIVLLSGCAMRRQYYPLFPRKTTIVVIRPDQYKYNRFTPMFNEADSAFNIWWEDSIKNPDNAEFVDEVSFNEGILFNNVIQEQFNKRYEIKWKQ